MGCMGCGVGVPWGGERGGLARRPLCFPAPKTCGSAELKLCYHAYRHYASVLLRLGVTRNVPG